MVAREENREAGKGLSGRIRDRIAGSRKSLGRIEAEGERFVKGVVDFVEKYAPEMPKKSLEGIAKDARGLIEQLNRTVEESTQRVLGKLNVPTREELEAMGKQLRSRLDEQVQKGLGRFNLATRKEVEQFASELSRLRKEVEKLSKAAAGKTASKKSAPKKAAARKKAKA